MASHADSTAGGGPPQARQRLRARLVPAVFLLVGLWICLEALQLPIGSVRAPGPGLFPLLLGLAFSLLSLGLLALSWRADPAEAGEVGPVRREVLYLIGAIFAAAWLFERAGFLLTMVAFLAIVLKALAQLRWPAAVAAAAIGGAAAYLLFDRVLLIALPSGILPF
jgi:putative tricarboxylic transport membrane protein